MSWFAHLTIRAKLVLSFSSVLLLMAALGVFSANRMHEINAASTEIANNWLPSAQYVAEMRDNLLDLRNAEMQFKLVNSPLGRQQITLNLQQSHDALQQSQARYEPLIVSAREAELYQRYTAARQTYLELRTFGDNGQVNLRHDSAQAQVAYESANLALDALVDLNIATARDVSTAADHTLRQSLLAMMWVLLLSVVLLELVSLALARHISQPIRRLAEAARALSAGDLSVRSLCAYTRNEIGELARCFDTMAEHLQRARSAAEAAAENLRQRYVYSQAVCRITAAVSKAASLELVCQYALDALREVMALERATIRLCDDQGGLRVIASRGISERYQRQLRQNNLWQPQDGVPETVWVADITQESGLEDQRAALVAEGIGALAHIPILIDRQLWGVLSLYYAQPQPRHEDNLVLAQTLAGYIGLTLERSRQTERLEHLALFDSLIDIPNRTLLYDRLRQTLAASGREGPLALLLIDLDRFKEVNDTLGHHQGDLILRQVASRLQGVLRQSDTVARIGGDEFVLLLPSVGSLEHAILTADKIIKGLRTPFTVGGIAVEIDASIGIVLGPEHGADPDTLMQHADVAMYAAKREGSGYVVYSPASDPHTPQRLILLGELRHAAELSQMELHYQPKLCLATRRVTGAEALVRWQHPRLGLLYPDQFIALAEQTGLIRPIELWVIEQSLRQHILWKAEGYDVAVAVNLSARNLHDLALPGQMETLLRQHRVDPSALEMELTESAIMQNPESALEVLVQLNAMGVALSIDDFGAGYSSFSYLKKLPVDAVKIDKSFVIDMERDNDSRMIVRAIIDIAHNMNMLAIAEGVEHADAWERLREFGCDHAQGYHISRPLPAEGFASWYRQHG